METQASQNQEHPHVVIARQTKNMGVGLILTIIFGSIGLLYSTVIGGLIMTFFVQPVLVLSLITGHHILSISIALFYWPICIYWTIKAINRYNSKLLAGEDTNEYIDLSLYSIIMFLLVSTFIFCGLFAIYDQIISKLG